MKYVGGWSQYGFSQAPTDVAVETYRIFEIKGSAVTDIPGTILLLLGKQLQRLVHLQGDRAPLNRRA